LSYYSGCQDQVLALGLSRNFGLHLAELSDTISPIYKHQVMAQTDHVHIGYVRGRWDAIWEHLKQCAGRATFGDYSRLWPVLEQRKKRQLIPLHTLAHWLMPQTVLTSRFGPGKPPSYIRVRSTNQCR